MFFFFKSEYSECEFQKATALARSRYCGLLGGFIPKCESDGSFSPMQCSPNGYCCCAKPECGERSDCVRAPNIPHCSK